MAELSFPLRAAQTLDSIREQLEALPACDDLDLEIVDAVLRVEFDDGSQIIVNRQEPVQQLWVASPLGPAHFAYDAARELWVDTKTGETLMGVLSRAFTLKLGEPVSLRD